MIRSLRIPIAAALAAILLPLTAWTAYAQTTTATPAGKPAAKSPTLTWDACPGGGGKLGIECAPLTVPLDWNKPGGRKVTLMLGRLKADDPAAGTVLVNFGGPGASGIQFMRDFVTTFDPIPFDNLRHKMNVVTWDPRGYPGYSKPAYDFSCLSNAPAEIRRMPTLPRSKAAFDKQKADSRTLANVCRPQDPELFDNMDTEMAIRDMEAIRQALGENQLNIYGGSYGGVYAQSYATAYPHRVRTMVLDGTGDHSADFGRVQDAIAGDNVKRWQRFSRWCASDEACVLHGQDVAAIWQGVVAKADQTPIPLPGSDALFDGATLREVATGKLIRGGGPADWAKFAKAIQTATKNDASGFVDDPARPYPNMGYPLSECREWPRFKTYGEYTRMTARLDKIDPNLGAAGTMIPFILTCLDWPSSFRHPPRALPPGIPPLLGVGTWGDFPATNRIVQRVPGSRSIYHDGVGHELYATGNACVITHVDHYFITKKLPPRGTTC